MGQFSVEMTLPGQLSAEINMLTFSRDGSRASALGLGVLRPACLVYISLRERPDHDVATRRGCRRSSTRIRRWNYCGGARTQLRQRAAERPADDPGPGG